MTQEVALGKLSEYCQAFLKNKEKRWLVLLEGPLGAGKTQFVKTCLKILGGDMPESPTFSLINEYTSLHGLVWHADLYRMTNSADIDSTGFWDLFREPEGLIFVEWPSKVSAQDWPLSWPQKKLSIDFTSKPDVRRFTLS